MGSSSIRLLEPILFMTDFETILAICRKIKDNGGRGLLVGGCVRDQLTSTICKDYDLEIYGIAPDALVKMLSEEYELDLVGQSFGILKIKHRSIDVSIPRRERKTGQLHTDFFVDVDPNMSIAEAAKRRDFTINAISFDPLTQEYFDPFNGENHLRAKVLHPVSERFLEDPLRVLRGMQFIARFDLEPTVGLIEYSKLLRHEYRNLARERVFEEFNKMLLKGHHIGKALKFLYQSGWSINFPELHALYGVAQDPEHHPEGCVFTHTGHCMDAFARSRNGNDVEDLTVGYAVLGHDFGKATHTTIGEDGRIHAYGHEDASGPLLDSFMRRLTNQEDLIGLSVALAKAHMRPMNLFEDKSSQSAIRRLAVAVGRLDLLCRVVQADQEGRPPLVSKHIECTQWILGQAAQLNIVSDKPKPIVMGRHLIGTFNMAPSKAFKAILDQAFEAQLDGIFTDEAGGIEYVRKLLQDGAIS